MSKPYVFISLNEFIKNGGLLKEGRTIFDTKNTKVSYYFLGKTDKGIRALKSTNNNVVHIGTKNKEVLCPACIIYE